MKCVILWDEHEQSFQLIVNLSNGQTITVVSVAICHLYAIHNACIKGEGGACKLCIINPRAHAQRELL